jgi:hypothetical protein
METSKSVDKSEDIVESYDNIGEEITNLYKDLDNSKAIHFSILKSDNVGVLVESLVMRKYPAGFGKEV